MEVNQSATADNQSATANERATRSNSAENDGSAGRSNSAENGGSRGNGYGLNICRKTTPKRNKTCGNPSFINNRGCINCGNTTCDKLGILNNRCRRCTLRPQLMMMTMMMMRMMMMMTMMMMTIFTAGIREAMRSQEFIYWHNYPIGDANPQRSLPRSPSLLFAGLAAPFRLWF